MLTAVHVNCSLFPRLLLAFQYIAHLTLNGEDVISTLFVDLSVCVYYDGCCKCQLYLLILHNRCRKAPDTSSWENFGLRMKQVNTHNNPLSTVNDIYGFPSGCHWVQWALCDCGTTHAMCVASIVHHTHACGHNNLNKKMSLMAHSILIAPYEFVIRALLQL